MGKWLIIIVAGVVIVAAVLVTQYNKAATQNNQPPLGSDIAPGSVEINAGKNMQNSIQKSTDINNNNYGQIPGGN